MTGSLAFDPLIPWAGIAVVAAALMLILGLAIWRRLTGWPLRALAGAVVIAALTNPSLQREDRAPLPDIVVVLVDETSSQSIAGRPAQTAAALTALEDRLARRGNTDVRIVRLRDAGQDGGTAALGLLSDTLANIAADRLGGVFMITDGLVHDAGLGVNASAPLHVLLTGAPDDWDRRLTVKNAPGFGILGEPLSLTLRVEDQGAAPGDETARVEIAIDGAPPQPFDLPIGQDMEITLRLPHGGINVLQLSTPAVDGELTDRNNAAVLRINGVRDRLRVLLVSGEPHAGTRTWRNLLKSDASVDLVHFTILRPLNKLQVAPYNELSLIAFPTRELFLDKIDEFDLIVFDRYKLRGLLPAAYFTNIADYVQRGGAVLVAAGPDYATVNSIYRSNLADVIPAVPTARVFEQPILPKISDLGERHPVTRGLLDDAPDGGWGRWLRQIEVQAPSGDVIMTGLDEKPLLVLDRVGRGRVAILASDHAWLWDRGFEGGGPQRELLRRLAHWMMKEPDLEEEALTASETDAGLIFTRRTLADAPPGPLTITTPDGSTVTLDWTQVAPGLFDVEWPTTQLGLYRATDSELDSVTALGPAAPREFQQTVATPDRLAPLVGQRQGGIVAADDVPRIRNVRDARPAAGRGWLGLYDRGAFATQSVSLQALLPGWAYLLLAAGLMLGAWLREGRRV